MYFIFINDDKVSVFRVLFMIDGNFLRYLILYMRTHSWAWCTTNVTGLQFSLILIFSLFKNTQINLIEVHCRFGPFLKLLVVRKWHAHYRHSLLAPKQK